MADPNNGMTYAEAGVDIDAGNRTVDLIRDSVRSTRRPGADAEIGGFGGDAYAKAHAGERHATASESDFGADRVWRFETNFATPAKPIGDRLAVALAPLGVVRGTGTAGDGTDIAPTVKTGLRLVIGSWKIIAIRRPRTAVRGFVATP